MSLLFITDFLPPSFSATGQYTYHFAKRYSKKKIKTSLIGIGNLNKTTAEPFLKVHTFKAINPSARFKRNNNGENFNKYI